MDFSTSSFSFTVEENFFFTLATVFFLTGVLFILFIMISRLYKNSEERIIKFLTHDFRDQLNTLIIMESEGESLTQDAFDSMILPLSAKLRSSKAKQVLIDQLIGFRKNLTGASSRSVEKIFVALKLEEFCLKKLSSISKRIVAEGIRELTILNYQQSLDKIRPYIKSKNQTVREEALMAIVRMDQDPLSFLNSYQGEITSWLLINIHQHLSKVNTRNLPEFKNWFFVSNKSIVRFAISMARQFRQMNAVPALQLLVKDQDTEIAEAAIRALGEMEAYEAADTLYQVSEMYWQHEKISQAIVKSLASIAQNDDQLSLIAKYLGHSSYEVQAEAVLALTTFGTQQKEILDQLNTKESGRFSRMMAHASEPLLK